MDDLSYLMEFIDIMKAMEEDEFQPNLLKFDDNSSSIKCSPNDFLLNGEILGRGGYGFVLKAMHVPSGNNVAMKFQKLTYDEPSIKVERTKKYQTLEKEIRGLRLTHSPYVTQYFGSMIVGRDVILCMELMDFTAFKLYKDVKMSLQDPTDRFDEQALAIIATSVLNALIDLKRTHHFIHRDIKPLNILLNFNGEVKLTDLGLIFEDHSIARCEPFGTSLYLAPEIIEQMSCKEIDGRYRVEMNSKSDLWSLGITLVEIARFSQPYTHCELIKDVYYSISMKESPVLTLEDGYSVETIQLVNNCLIKDERRRPSLEEISEIDLIQKYGDFESNKAYMKNFICKYVHMYNGLEEDSVGCDSSDSSIIEETIQQWRNDSLVNFMSFDNIVACH